MKYAYLIKNIFIFAILSSSSLSYALEYKPYISLGVSSYQPDFTVENNGSFTKPMLGGFTALGVDFPINKTIDLGLQVRAGGSQSVDGDANSPTQSFQVKFPQYSLFLVPQYQINSQWHALALIGTTQAPKLNYLSASGTTKSASGSLPLSLGLGIQYEPLKNMRIGAEWVSYIAKKDVAPKGFPNASLSLSAISLTLSYYFDTSFNKAIPTAVKGIDSISPKITLLGEAEVHHFLGQAYNDAGATAWDDTDGNLNNSIIKSGFIDTTKEGRYTLKYQVSDHAGNKSKTQRTIYVSLDPSVLNLATTLTIHFDEGKYNLPPIVNTTISALAIIMEKYPSLQIEIYGHADSIGSENDNKVLSLKRAKRVARELINTGVNKKRITTLGFGSSRPINTGESETSRAENRRVEFRFKK